MYLIGKKGVLLALVKQYTICCAFNTFALVYIGLI